MKAPKYIVRLHYIYGPESINPQRQNTEWRMPQTGDKAKWKGTVLCFKFLLES
jgi:hypothetical protein